MDKLAASQSTIMDSARVGRAPSAPGPFLWRRPILDGEAARLPSLNFAKVRLQLKGLFL